MKKAILQSLFFTLFLSSSNFLMAQQSRVDSLLVMLKEVKPNNELDTVKFLEFNTLLYNTTLNENQILTIEKNAQFLDEGKNQDLSFYIKVSIFRNLVRTDHSRAISFGEKLLIEIERSKTPNARIMRDGILSILRIPYRNSDQLEKGFEFYNSKLVKFNGTKDASGLATVHYVLSGFYSTIGLYDEAIYHLKKSNSFTNYDPHYNTKFFGILKRNIPYYEVQNYSVIGNFYYDKGDLDESLKLSLQALDSAQKGGEAFSSMVSYLISNLVRVKLALNDLKDIPYLLKTVNENLESESLSLLALLTLESHYHIKSGSFDLADSLLTFVSDKVNKEKIPVNSPAGTINPDYYLALLRIAQNRPEEAIKLLDKDILRLGNLRAEILKDYRLQSSLYELLGDYRNAYQVNEKYIDLEKKIKSDADKFRRVSFEVEQEINQKELSINSLQAENEIASITQKFIIGLAIMLLLLASMIYYRFRSKKKANAVLETTLSNLKSTQTQLIQSEKMASLGELTAGIAHEIQNPLNFVNNFSEVSEELIIEIEEERAKSLEARDETLVNEILRDVKENLSKINHHGKRADSIVKGMLAHSRSSSGEKVSTDINVLADEFLRLSYHGLRAKDNTFYADFTTDFDPDLPKVSVIPQDIGRVLLNIINNAFQACGPQVLPVPIVLGENLAELELHKPMVTVSTKNLRDKIQISIKDNGPGIPDAIKDKIFQPFFTTKPTGEGTGLGLSLSYDIIKSHGGEIVVESSEGEGTTFIVSLLITNHTP